MNSVSIEALLLDGKARKAIGKSALYSKGKKTGKKRVDRELPEQRALIDWARLTVISGYRVGDYLTHVPNEGKRGPKAQKEFKELGGSAGYPDLILDIPNKFYHGLRIEMKPDRKHRSKVSEKQQEWQVKLNKMGYLALICYGYEEARTAIVGYLGEEG